MFGSIGDELLAAAGISGVGEEFIGGLIADIFLAAGVAGAASGLGITIATAIMGGGPMAVVIIVLALVVIIAAVLLFFVMLGARMIIVILCMAVSPVAFVCFILPNTQVFFKKWVNTFKIAILMYPLCGALGGISVLIRGMVVGMSGVHLWMMVMAMVMPFLPFFLLPSLLRGAIAALGKVGGAMMAMGSACAED